MFMFKQADTLWCVVAPNGSMRVVCSEDHAKRIVESGDIDVD